MNPELDRLLAQLEPSSPANQAHRLAFGLLCARRVEHLLEDAEVIDLLRKFESAMAAAASAEAVAPWAARARELAQQHRGSPSLDGVDHAAVSATQACASAMSGRARDAATHGAYARVYGQGGDGAVSDPRALEPEYAWMAGELQHLLQQGKVVSSAAAAAQVACTLRDPAPGDLAWIVHRQTVLYAQAQGWNNEFEALASEIVARFIRSYDPAWERCWVAHAQEQIVGSVFLVRQGPHTAQLRMLYVEPSARGTGIGGMLVAACLDFARQVGYRRMMLWTNSVLTDARRLYQRTGFQLEGEESHHSFGQDLVGQIWGRDL